MGDPKRGFRPGCSLCGRPWSPAHAPECAVGRALAGPRVPVQLFPLIALVVVALLAAAQALVR